jgi:hypothetical protein
MSATEPLSRVLRRLHEEATPGPWEADIKQPLDCVVWGPGKRRDGFVANIGSAMVPVIENEENEPEAMRLVFDAERADTVLIATLRNALPALADLVEETEAEYAGHREGCTCTMHGLLAALRERLGAKP